MSNQNTLAALKEVEAMINEEGDRYYKGSLSPEELQAFEELLKLCQSLAERFS
jgi:phosphopantetheinyl transferase (holo-ACP synthase)